MIFTATIQSTLSIVDKMSGPLKSIEKQMNAVTAAMRGLESVGIGLEFESIGNEADYATTEIEQMSQEIDNIGRGNGFESQAGQAIAFNAVLEIAQKGIQLVKAGINEIGELTGLADASAQAETSLAVVLANMGNSYEDYQNILEQAGALSLKTTLDDEGLLSGMAEIATYISDPAALEKIMPTFADFAIGMNAGDPRIAQAQAVQYATALGKALQGQYDGLTKKGFTVSEQQKEIIQKGTEMERVAVVSDIIGESWSGMAEAVAMTDLGKIVQMENATEDLKESIGKGLYPYVLQFQQLLSDVLNPVLAFVAEHLDIIAPIAIVLGAALGALAIVVGVYTVAQWAMNAAILANPITWIIVGVVALIAIIAILINKMGGLQAAWAIVTDFLLASWDLVKLGFFVGVYGVLNLWDKMSLGMQKAGAAIADFMGDMKVNVLTILQNMINGAIDIINDFVNVLNKIPGVEIEAIEHVTFATTAAAENEAAKQVRAVEIAIAETEATARMAERDAALNEMALNTMAAHAERQANIAELQAKAAAEEPSLVEKIFSGAGGYNPDDDPINDVISGGSVKTTGEVKISDEDIKMLLDISTRDYMVTYQTLTPEISLNIDTIRETADVNQIVDTIATWVEETSETRLVTE